MRHGIMNLKHVLDSNVLSLLLFILLKYLDNFQSYIVNKIYKISEKNPECLGISRHLSSLFVVYGERYYFDVAIKTPCKICDAYMTMIFWQKVGNPPIGVRLSCTVMW